MTTLFCVDPNEVSLLGSLVLARGGGSFEYYIDSSITETHLVDGGAPEIAKRLAAKLGDALHLSSPVQRIRQTSAGVEVFSDQLTVDAQRVIVATPPLLAGRIEYDPPLPEAHAQLLRRMVCGSAIRGITIYDEPFWRKDGLSGMSVAPIFLFLSRSINSHVRGVPVSLVATCLDLRRSKQRGSSPRNAAISGSCIGGAIRNQGLITTGASGDRLGR
jgi:monoamine oxidase